MDYVVLISYFLAVAGGFGLHFLWDLQVKRTALSMVRAQASLKGTSARKEQESDLMELIADIGLQLKEAKASGEDVKTALTRILPAAAAKHPQTAMKLGGKLFKQLKDGGGIGAIEELFG